MLWNTFCYPKRKTLNFISLIFHYELFWYYYFIKVIAVIVTYGNRYVFLDQVVQASFNTGVSGIWWSSNESKEKVDSLKNMYPELRLITNENNVGSGGAYSIILDVVDKRENDFFLVFRWR